MNCDSKVVKFEECQTYTLDSVLVRHSSLVYIIVDARTHTQSLCLSVSLDSPYCLPSRSLDICHRGMYMVIRFSYFMTYFRRLCFTTVSGVL